MLEQISGMSYNGINISNLLIITLVIVIVYSLVFFYLAGNYVMVNNRYINKKLIKDLSLVKKTLDDLLLDKTYIETINTTLSMVINYKFNDYSRSDRITISFDKINNAISVLTPNTNNIYILHGNLTQTEVNYVEEELSIYIPTR